MSTELLNYRRAIEEEHTTAKNAFEQRRKEIVNQIDALILEREMLEQTFSSSERDFNLVLNVLSGISKSL